MLRRGSFILRIAVAGVFVFAAWEKLTHPIQDFEFVIAQYELLPSSWIPLVARALPWAELFLGACLMLGFLRKFSAQFLACMTAGFLVFLVSSVARGIDLASCGCFGEQFHFTQTQAILLDSGLLLSLIALCIRKSGWLELDDWLQKS